MKNDTLLWLKYAEENLESARILSENGLYNPCLQNIQQAVEKFLKALISEKDIPLVKTHSITELHNTLKRNDIIIDLSEEDCDFLDSIYLPSKYPVSSVLPYYEPDQSICDSGLEIAANVFIAVKTILSR